ncbi:hypothetical protein [Mucilaginibacter sp. CSA2-8R]|uniref:hypothetical protein n=1 Tax=Mucilaginibacter sp. CSA2-8R TaxID=3141542 RepID=UPI00315D155E
MKKFIYIAALFISTGIISSCTKENGVKPTVSKVAGEPTIDNPPIPADGGIDRPKKP